MALFINVDPVPATCWKRKVHQGWQFGYSGGTENDFMIDIEVAKWRFACYIGFKKIQNPSPKYEKHLKWRKEQELARKRANKPESAFKRLWRSLRRTEAPSYRVDQERAQEHKAPSHARQFVDTVYKLRFRKSPNDGDHQRRFELATRPDLSESVHRNAVAPIEGKLLREEHQGQAPHHHDQEEPEAGRLPREPNA